MRYVIFGTLLVMVMAGCQSVPSSPHQVSVATYLAEEVNVEFAQHVIHVSEPILFTIRVENNGSNTLEDNLSYRLMGSPIENPFYATALRIEEVASGDIPLQLNPGEVFEGQYSIPYEEYANTHTGNYRILVSWHDQTDNDVLTVAGAADVEVTLDPSTIDVGEATTITAVVSNPTSLILHDVILNMPYGSLVDYPLGDLAPGQSASHTWAWTPATQDDGFISVPVQAESVEGGVSVGNAELTLLAPAELKVRADILAERIAVGEDFALEVYLWNYGSFPIKDITVTILVDENDPFTIDEPLNAHIDELGPNGETSLTWYGTVTSPGWMFVDVSATNGNLSDEQRTGATAYQPGHGVDLTINGEGVGINREAMVEADVSTPAHSNITETTFEVIVTNTGSVPDTYQVSAMPDVDSIVTLTGPDGDTSITQFFELDPGESVTLWLTVGTRAESATASVTVHSAGDPDQWDFMRVKIV